LPNPHWPKEDYTSYFDDRGASYLEEAMANAYLARSIGRSYRNLPVPGLLLDALLRAMDRQPEPYNQYRWFLGNERHARGRDELIDRMYIFLRAWLRLSGYPTPLDVLGSAMYFAGVTPTASPCPAYLVVDKASQFIRIGKPFPKSMGLEVIVYSNDHRPAHIHVRDLNRPDRDFKYSWPSLEPCSPDKRLPSALEKNLRDYVGKHRSSISARIQNTYGMVDA
jgi:hypothetical protein